MKSHGCYTVDNSGTILQHLDILKDTLHVLLDVCWLHLQGPWPARRQFLTFCDSMVA